MAGSVVHGCQMLVAYLHMRFQNMHNAGVEWCLYLLAARKDLNYCTSLR